MASNLVPAGSMTETTLSKDTVPPFHYRSPYLRQIPHYRTCLPSIGHSCNLFADPPSLRLRRIAFLCIISLRIIEAIFFTFVLYIRKPSLLIPGILLTLVVFFIVAWNLHLVVEAEGQRQLFRARISGRAFGAFLWVLVVVHVVLIWLEITGLSCFVDGTQRTWAFWVFTICVAAWVAGKEPVDGSLSLV
ncbi:hypothetical protein M3J09_010663 [Ascochyta lentis]